MDAFMESISCGALIGNQVGVSKVMVLEKCC